jgi:hypothetical protein
MSSCSKKKCSQRFVIYKREMKVWNLCRVRDVVPEGRRKGELSTQDFVEELVVIVFNTALNQEMRNLLETRRAFTNQPEKRRKTTEEDVGDHSGRPHVHLRAVSEWFKTFVESEKLKTVIDGGSDEPTQFRPKLRVICKSGFRTRCTTARGPQWPDQSLPASGTRFHLNAHISAIIEMTIHADIHDKMSCNAPICSLA